MRQDSLIHRAGCRRSYPARWPGQVERCTCGAVDGWEIHEPDPVTPAPGGVPTEVLRAAADGEMVQALDALRSARERTIESGSAVPGYGILADAVDEFLDVAEDIVARFPLPTRPLCADDDCRTSGACQDAGRCWGPPKAGV